MRLLRRCDGCGDVGLGVLVRLLRVRLTRAGDRCRGRSRVTDRRLPRVRSWLVDRRDLFADLGFDRVVGGGVVGEVIG